MIYPKVSVIIPSYNRADKVGLTIQSFLDQTYPANNFEIIVADNNSDDHTARVVKEFEKSGRVKYLFEPRQGVHYARNSASKIACGDILYFTDDDMIADKDLLLEMVKVIEIDPNIASVTGKILPKWEVEPPAWVKKLCYNYLLSLNDPPEELIISKEDCGVFSCHQMIRKDVFIQSGGFNPENTAGEWIGDGETGLNIKIKELGYKFGYSGESVIYHMIPASRMTQSYLNKRLKNQGNCDSYTAYRKYRYNRKQLVMNIFKYVVLMIICQIKYSIYSIKNRHIWRLGVANLFYYWARVKYDYRLMYDTKWQDLVLRKNWLD